MSDPYETWLRERWPKLMSVEALIAETAWNACERLHHAEIERLKEDNKQLLGEVSTGHTAIEAADVKIERLEAEIRLLRSPDTQEADRSLWMRSRVEVSDE